MRNKYSLFSISFLTLMVILTSARGQAATAVLSDTMNNAVATDTTVRATQLDEVVVEGDWQWREGEKFVFRPQKRQKNISQTPEELLARMNLPVLKYSGATGTSVTGLDGEPIVIYINGVKATDVDLHTFWPKQCIRVEYMEKPTDPIFGGNENVINFIMPVYEWGGLTKLYGQQTIPNAGSYSAASKFVHKRMSFGLTLQGGYARDHISGSTSEAEFRNVYHKETFYDAIRETSEEHRAWRRNFAGGAFNAVYTNGFTVINHQVSLNWNNNPDYRRFGTLQYSPDIINGSTMNSVSDSRALSPVVSGRYQFLLPHNTFLLANWQYSYNHNNASSNYLAGNSDDIFNSSREDVHSVFGQVYVGRRFGKVSVNTTLNTAYDWYHTIYGGTYDDDVRQRRGNTSLDVNLQFSPNRYLTMTLTPKLALAYWQLDNHESYTQFTPGGEMRINLNWNDNMNSTTLLLNYLRQAPGASTWSDAMRQTSELWWVKGNPAMKVQQTWLLILSHNFRFTREFSMSVMGNWTRTVNAMGLNYYAASPEQGGLVQEYFNSPGQSTLSAALEPRLSLFNGNFTIWAQARVLDCRNIGRTGEHQFMFNALTNVNYYFGNFSVGAYYNAPQKSLTVTNRHTRVPQQYGVDFGYGNGNFSVRLSADNLFNKYKTTRNWQAVDYYTAITNSRAVGRSLTVTLSYTFDYGKRVTDRSTIGVQSDSKSSVLQ